MIKSFADKETHELAQGGTVRRLPASIRNVARRKLFQLDTAMRLEDLKQPPGNRLHALSGNRKGQHAIRINDQFRMCFRWEAGHAFEVEITDYH